MSEVSAGNVPVTVDAPPAAIVDDRPAAARRSGHPTAVWTFMGFIVTDMLSGHTSNLRLPVGPDRLFLAATVLLVLLDRRYSLKELRLRWVHAIALSVLAIASLSALAYGELFTSLGFFALLDRLTIPYAIFAFAPWLLKRPEDRLLLLKTFSWVGVYLGLTAAFEILGPHSLVFPRYIMDPSVGIQFGRARGPFAESEADGMTLLAAAYCALALQRRAPSRLWRRFAAVAVLIAMVGALLTLTRSVWIGLVVSLVLVAIVDRSSRRLVITGAVLVAIISGAVLLSSQTLSNKVSNRADTQRSVYDRRNTDAAAIRAIEAHPLTGIGWLRFLSESETYVRQNPNYPITNVNIEVHNVVLSRTAELGIPGGALWVLSVLLGPGYAAVRRPRCERDRTWRMVSIGIFASWSVPVMTSPVPYPLPNIAVWLAAGLALSAYLLQPGVLDDEDRGPY